MKILRLVGLCALLCLPLSDAFAEGARPSEPVALVYSLQGEATLTVSSEEPRPLRLFDRLPAGAIVEVKPGSRLALAFTNGRRYELGERSRATLGPQDLSLRSGPVRSLPSVPTLPRLLPIADEEQPGVRAGAVRIRAERIAGLYPRHGAATLAGTIVLRFEPVDGAGRYQVEVQDRQGNVVSATETTASPMNLPAEVLQPGVRYHWVVRTIERVGPVAKGEADFVTLPSALAEKRETLRRVVEEEGDGASLALLAEVDRSLGMLLEARDGFRAALEKSPGDAALQEALSELERRLAEESSEEIGVIIEAVTPESLGARAGFQVGDVLLSWCRMAASFTGPCLAEGRFESPFDFMEVDFEQAPRGGVRVLGERAGASTTWALLPGSQSVEVRPLQQAGEGRLGIWLLLQEAGSLAEARQWPRADALYQEAVDRSRLLRDQNVETQILKAWGKTFQSRGIWQKAEDLYRRSLELDRAAGRDLSVAWTLHSLGTIAAQRSDFQGAETLLRQALAIREELAPRSSSLAASLRNLGNVMLLWGDFTSAEDHLGRALSIQEELAPGSLDTAGVLINLGAISSRRGNYAITEGLYRRAKVICERSSPESLEMAKALKNLGVTAVHRGDPETADYFLHRALAIEERIDASGAAVASTLENLGLRAFDRGDWERAEEHLRRALSLNEKLAPAGRSVALNLQNLGAVALRRGDCAAAEDLLRRAYAIRQKLNPDSLEVAVSLSSLGSHASKCGDLSRAEDNYRRAVTIQERLAPRSHIHAISLYNLGEVYQRQGHPQAAEEFLCRAAEISESQRELLSRAEASNKKLFTDCLAARIEIGQPADAFQALERGRARAFLEQLAERDLLFSGDLPEEIARRRKGLAKELESTQGALTRLSSTQDAGEAERLLNRLREIRDQQRELTVQIRRSSPRFASLQYPESLDLAGARRALDPGTVLLSYAVGKEKSYLFVIQPSELQGSGLSVFSLPIGEEALREAVRSFRNLLQKSDSDRSQLMFRASSLYDLLIGPAEAQIAKAKRILVSADGPLYTLPFAALVRKGQYLIEWKPLHSILSATVYAELKRTRRTTADPGQGQLVAFGDPVYPPLPEDRETAPAGTLEVLTAVRRGLSLDPLPATRSEVEGIASLYPRARVYLGAEATEERAKAVGSEARILHFASHGLLNERFPLDSALALTLPSNPAEGRDNGLLQAWEILESVRLDADLVTLSACDTALGKEMGGEGLIGLTRAFQYAGARSVLASLWSVSDISTGDLMKRFYGHLRSSKPKDEALQAAQIALIRSPEFSHPYYWAAFQLVGDWK